MIQRLCPDGVEYRKLVSVAKVQYGYPFDSKLFTDNPSFIPLIRIRDVKSGLAGTYYSGPILSDYIVCAGDILVGMDGEFNLGKWKDRDSLLNQRVCKITSLDSNIVLDGFLYHLLLPLFKKVEESISGSTVKHLSAKVINALEIPVPPLEVQRKIVEVLDNFSELTAELTARQKQYEYYRDNLLNFNRGGQVASDVKWMKMSEVGTFTRGRRFVRADIVEQGYPCIHYGDMYTYYGLSAMETKTYIPSDVAKRLRFAQKNDVVIVGAGENDEDIGIGVAWLGDSSPAVHDACYIFHHNQNPKFISHYLRTSFYHKQIKTSVSSGKICSISAEGIGKALIPIPPLSEQERIVSILDRFEALTTDLTSGLPADIKARQQQYEYYRDQLLTFKRAN